jgi:hypothetical protein
MWKIDLTQVQQYYEKTGHTKGRSHKEGEGKRRKLRR